MNRSCRSTRGPSSTDWVVWCLEEPRVQVGLADDVVGGGVLVLVLVVMTVYVGLLVLVVCFVVVVVICCCRCRWW